MRRSAVLASQRAAAITQDIEVVFDEESPEDSTLHVKVRPMGLSVRQREALARLAPVADSGELTEAEGAELLDLLCGALGALVASWDLTDEDGSIVSLAPESLRSMGLDEVVVLWGAIQEAAAAAPFGMTSGS